MGRISPADFYLKHVADSLAVLPVWPEILNGPVRLADVGCGAGMPGIVLAAALPELHLTAIESSRKKAAFVELASAELGLSGRVEVANRRSRELGRLERYWGRFNVVTARAVGRADKIIRENRMLLAPGGSVILYKTPSAVAEELALARREAGKHKLTIEISEPITLPAEAGTRQFIRITTPE